MAEPKCKFFGKCGGCATQHVDYELQLKNKEEVLRNASGHTGNIQVFSGDPYNYRNRMDPHFRKGGIGFREKGRFGSIVDVNECKISNKKLNELLKEVRDHWPEPDYFNPIDHTGTLRYAVIRTPQNDSSISFVVNQDSTRVEEAIQEVKEFARKTTANNILVTYMPAKSDMSIGSDYIVIKGKDMLEETLLGKTFYYSVQGFFQNNHHMAEEMHRYVNELLKTYDTSQAHLLDLYGGVGTFGIINSDLFKSVTTLESFQGCTDSAVENIALNGAKNVEAVCKDAKLLKNVELPKPLYVITDPPRAGMHPKTIRQLQDLDPELIIYISCNVKQLAKDMPKFRDYDIKSAAIFDLFPQTNHMESVLELVKKR